MSTTPEVRQAIIQMSKAGHSNRKIARMLLGRGSRESTVRGILARSARVRDIPAKILILDIETAPNRAFHWQRWKQNIGQDQVISESYILTWAAKWLHDPESIMSDAIWYHDGYKKDAENDVDVVRSLSELINEADFVVAHNGDRFDIPVLKTRMAFHGMHPLNPFRSIDTYRIARKEFRLPSNSLRSIAEYFQLENKMDAGGFKLWRSVVHDQCPEAQAKMMEYNIQDIVALEDVYLLLRPWDTRHPNLALYSDLEKVICPCCGSDDVRETGTFDYTNASKFPVIRCNSCGTVKSTRFTVLTKEQRRNSLRNTR